MAQETLKNSDSESMRSNGSGDMSKSNAENQKSPAKNSANVSWASPRYWHGMGFLTYLRLLWSGRFRIHFVAIGMTIALFFYAISNSVLRFAQWLILGRQISATSIDQPPLFIVGHWRSGTTLVHELLSLDEQLAAPNTYQCFVPSHFLLTEWCFKPMVGMVMPATRPMDNMPTGPDRPNEDEFAYCALGAPSPYRMLAFPNMPRPDQEFIDMVDVDPKDREKLEQAIMFFAKSLTYKNSGKRLVLKSPTNTGRIDLLRQLFPGAKFLYISRDPKDVVPSTVRLWNRLAKVNGFQVPKKDPEEMQDYVGQTFARMERAFDAATSNQHDDLVILRYEEVVEDPVGKLGEAYQQLGLEGFEELAPRLKSYMDSQADYQKNKHQLDERLTEIINQHCAAYQQKYGYAKV